MRERRVEFAAAWDKRHPDPKKNFGVHGVEIRFLLGDQDGLIQLVIFTNWMLDCMHSFGDGYFRIKHGPPIDEYHWMAPMAADLGYHSLVPRYENQQPINAKCPYLGDRPCYYDGSSLNADRVFHVLLHQGGEGVWREMEAEYDRVFASVEAAR